MSKQSGVWVQREENVIVDHTDGEKIVPELKKPSTKSGDRKKEGLPTIVFVANPVDGRSINLAAVGLFIRSTSLFSMAAMTLPVGCEAIGFYTYSTVRMIEAVNIWLSGHGSFE